VRVQELAAGTAATTEIICELEKEDFDAGGKNHWRLGTATLGNRGR